MATQSLLGLVMVDMLLESANTFRFTTPFRLITC
jgi:hypothetical protein